jgi:hypothetical protein
LIAGSAAGAAPGEVGRAEEGLGACCVDATGDAELEGFSGGEGKRGREDRGKRRRNTNLPTEFGTSACGTASTGAFLAIVVALLRD